MDLEGDLTGHVLRGSNLHGCQVAGLLGQDEPIPPWSAEVWHDEGVDMRESLGKYGPIEMARVGFHAVELIE